MHGGSGCCTSSPEAAYFYWINRGQPLHDDTPNGLGDAERQLGSMLFSAVDGRVVRQVIEEDARNHGWSPSNI